MLTPACSKILLAVASAFTMVSLGTCLKLKTKTVKAALAFVSPATRCAEITKTILMRTPVNRLGFNRQRVQRASVVVSDPGFRFGFVTSSSVAECPAEDNMCRDACYLNG